MAVVVLSQLLLWRLSLLSLVVLLLAHQESGRFLLLLVMPWELMVLADLADKLDLEAVAALAELPSWELSLLRAQLVKLP